MNTSRILSVAAVMVIASTPVMAGGANGNNGVGNECTGNSCGTTITTGTDTSNATANVSNRNVNRNQNRNTNVNRNENRNVNRNSNKNVNRLSQSQSMNNNQSLSNNQSVANNSSVTVNNGPESTLVNPPSVGTQDTPMLQGGGVADVTMALPKFYGMTPLKNNERVTKVLRVVNGGTFTKIRMEDLFTALLENAPTGRKVRYSIYMKDSVTTASTGGGVSASLAGGQGAGTGSVLPGWASSTANPSFTIVYFEVYE